MKAAREIGWRKIGGFGFMTLAMVPYRIALFPPVRVTLLRLYGARIGKRVVMHDTRFFNLYRRGLGGLTIGEECFIGDECLLDLAEEIHLGDQVTLAERVMILTHTNVGYDDHPLQKHFPASATGVTIERGCFIGAGATLLPGVRIGERSFVAAGAVVTENVEACSLVAGMPARLIRRLA